MPKEALTHSIFVKRFLGIPGELTEKPLTQLLRCSHSVLMGLTIKKRDLIAGEAYDVLSGEAALGSVSKRDLP